MAYFYLRCCTSIFMFILLIGFSTSVYHHNLKDETLKNKFPSAIIGGSTTSIKKHPYQVAIIVNGTFEGSGILVSKNWVVTLASIVLQADPDEIKIKAGNENYSKGRTYDVCNVTLHPQFDFFKLNNDIALLKLTKFIPKKSKVVKKILIGSSMLNDGDSVTLSGWGDTKDNNDQTINFKEVTLNIVSKENCVNKYSNYTKLDVSESIICAYKKDVGPCWFDFGDVITAQNKAYGIFSWAKGCAEDDYPGVYTDLVELKPWINANINNRILLNKKSPIRNEVRETIKGINKFYIRKTESNFSYMNKDNKLNLKTKQNINNIKYNYHLIKKRQINLSSNELLSGVSNILEPQKFLGKQKLKKQKNEKILAHAPKIVKNELLVRDKDKIEEKRYIRKGKENETDGELSTIISDDDSLEEGYNLFLQDYYDVNGKSEEEEKNNYELELTEDGVQIDENSRLLDEYENEYPDDFFPSDKRKTPLDGFSVSSNELKPYLKSEQDKLTIDRETSKDKCVMTQSNKCIDEMEIEENENEEIDEYEDID